MISLLNLMKPQDGKFPWYLQNNFVFCERKNTDFLSDIGFPEMFDV